jgi:UDP-N-acetylglucosamine 4,6-dehydratase
VPGIKELFEDKKILVTGGVGSVGQTLVRELLKYDPEVVRILDIDETGEFQMQQDLKDYSNLRFLLGDIRDKERLMRAFEGIDIVFHAASLKHVYACEYNPFEAVKTNVMGTQRLIDVAIDEEVEKVIFTSSDKSVNPPNVLGATKLLAERLMIAANYYKGSRRTRFTNVRFGNVVSSRGSVVSLFIKQIQMGGPVTITDPRMSRFVLSMSQAIDLVFKATELTQGGETFIPKMPALKVVDLAKVLIEELSLELESGKDAIEIKIAGRKPGEKLFEELLTEDEVRRSLETEDMFILLPEIKGYFKIDETKYSGAKKARMSHYRSKDAKILTKREIRDLLYKEGLTNKQFQT